MSRNVCVNLGIDPDTRDGFTRNVRVSRSTGSSGAWESWLYDPKRSLAKHGFGTKETLLFEEVCEEVEPSKKRSPGGISRFAEDEDLAVTEAVDCSSMGDDEQISSPPGV